MPTLEDIKRRWEEHERGPFPPNTRGKKVSGIDLTLLESEIARFIMTTLSLNAPLSARSKGMFQQHRETLDKVLPQLDGAARRYFERLHAIAKDVYQFE